MILIILRGAIRGSGGTFGGNFGLIFIAALSFSCRTSIIITYFFIFLDIVIFDYVCIKSMSIIKGELYFPS